MFCGQCGKCIPESSVFCSFCGQIVAHHDVPIVPPRIPSSEERQFAPLISVDPTFSLSRDFLSYKGKQFAYSSIKELAYSRSVASMNLMRISDTMSLVIVLDSDEIITLDVDQLAKKHSGGMLALAYQLLQQTTFEIRLRKIIATMNSNGYVTFGVPEVRLYRDQTIEDSNGRRQRICKSNASLRIGFGAQGVYFTDPNEIRISDKPRPFLQFECFESRNTIKFHLYKNMDVIRAIFEDFLRR
jgi:hypothetical protein